MASEEDHITVYNDDDEEPLNDAGLDDDDDDEDAVAGDASDSDEADADATSSAAIPAVIPLSSSSAVSIAVLPPSSSAPANGSNSPALAGATTAVAAAAAVVAMEAPDAPVAATPVSERKPIDDSRKLFQRLWTDEDEIELLRGFLEFTAQKGANWSRHHHDTTAFYDQIKSKIQLDCNKNQLVEKLRRLKKKYRNVVSRISSGKEFVFKSPHDQATFEISRKIWINLTSNRPEFDDDDQNPNPSSGTPAVATFHSAGDYRTPSGFGIDINNSDKVVVMMNMGTHDMSRKRSRVKMEEKSLRNVNLGGYEAFNAAPAQGGLVEETVRSCLSPLLKEFIDNAAARIGFVGGGSRGIGSLVLNAIPVNLPVVSLGSCGDLMDERWRKQHVLELEVYSKRLELIQDQIKLALEELRSKGS